MSLFKNPFIRGSAAGTRHTFESAVPEQHGLFQKLTSYVNQSAREARGTAIPYIDNHIDGQPSGMIPGQWYIGEPTLPQTVDTASSIDKWRAGGGGSRERLNGFKETFQDQLPAVATPMTLDEMIKQYWVYGAVAVVGIIVLSKATK